MSRPSRRSLDMVVVGDRHTWPRPNHEAIQKGKELRWRMSSVLATLVHARKSARETVDTVGNPLVILWTVMVGIRHT